MADDKTKRGGTARARVAVGEGYKVSYFARSTRSKALTEWGRADQALPDL